MPYSLDKARILIVDDMQPMLDLAKSVLSIFGFQDISTAQNGEEAFKLLCAKDPDLVITDWMMPAMDGIEFTKMVRTHPMSPNPYVPVLMMTGFSSKLRVESARDGGITEFLVKPFTSQDLYTRVQQIIEKPRQFVDAEQFFGPDRRRKSDDGYEGARRRDSDDNNNPDKSMDSEQQKAAANILNQLREETKNVQ